MTTVDIDEVEVKLLAPDEPTLLSIAGLRSIGRFGVEPVGTAHLRTTYLDTDDRRLSERRIALRVRSDPTAPRGSVLTAKWAGDVRDDVHVRRELTVPLPSGGIPRRLPAGALRDELGEVVGDKPLEALVTTAIERRTALVRDAEGAAVAELALDVVRHGGSDLTPSSPAYFEVEIELLQGGSPSALAEIGSLLRAQFPLRPTNDTKFTRAMREHGDGS